MFVVDTENYKIDLHRGDTGVIGITLTGHTFGADDRVLFTIKDQEGKIVKEGVYALTNNRFEVEFLNADTDHLMPGQYSWDVRCVVNPVYANNAIIDGDAVATPRDPMVVNLRTTVGQV